MAKHYIRLNEKGEVIKGFSDELEVPETDDICINEDGGRHFNIDGDIELVTENGIYKYKYKNNKVISKTEKEITKELNILQLEQLKISKLSEISSACEYAITNGVEVETSKGIKHFSLSTSDQMNLTNLSIRMQAGDPLLANGIPYHADGELCELWSNKDFITISTKATEWVFYNTTYYNYLKMYVNSIQSYDELEKVYYGMELPKEYQEQMNIILGMNK